MRQKIIKVNEKLPLSSAINFLKIINSILGKYKLKEDFYDLVKPLLREFLHKVLVVEHTTIPVYLTALYSIKDGTNIVASQVIRSVVVEEMLHMILVCNVMNALGLKPTVNTVDDYPKFPCRLPLKNSVLINLEAYSYNSISTFIAIEKPSFNEVDKPVESEYVNQFYGDDLARIVIAEWNKILKLDGSEYINQFYGDDLEPIVLAKWNEILKLDGNELSEYSISGDFKFKISKTIVEVVNLLRGWLNEASTIGELYGRVFQVICVVYGLVDEVMFCGKPELQILPEHYYGSGGNIIGIHSIDDIKLAFDEIIDQGEGASYDGFSSMYDKDASQFGEGYELAHYFRFKEILHEHFYVGGDYEKFLDEHGRIPISTPPVGKKIDIDWDAAYRLVKNPKIKDYYNYPHLLEQAQRFNVTYRRLLDAIQYAIEGRQEELIKSVMYMHSLRELAIELMKQPFIDGLNAAPTFEYVSL